MTGVSERSTWLSQFATVIPETAASVAPTASLPSPLAVLEDCCCRASGARELDVQVGSCCSLLACAWLADRYPGIALHDRNARSRAFEKVCRTVTAVLPLLLGCMEAQIFICKNLPGCCDSLDQRGGDGAHVARTVVFAQIRSTCEAPIGSNYQIAAYCSDDQPESL